MLGVHRGEGPAIASTDELLAAVLANPADDEVRKVYGDALVEAGDPRGELIALQFARLDGRGTPESAERERVLLERHGPDMLGPLISVVDRYEIEKGFVRACSVPQHRSAYNVERVVGHPLWATVEELEGPSAIYVHPVMRSLRSLTTHYNDHLGALCADPPAAVRELACEAYFPQLGRAVLDVVKLPSLAVLRIDSLRTPDELATFAGSALATRLECLEVGARDGVLSAWHPAVVAARPATTVTLRSVGIGPWRGRCELSGSAYERARVECWYHHSYPALDLVALLGRIRELHVRVKRGYGAVPPTAVQTLVDAVARFPASSLEVVP